MSNDKKFNTGDIVEIEAHPSFGPDEFTGGQYTVVEVRERQFYPTDYLLARGAVNPATAHGVVWLTAGRLRKARLPVEVAL